MKEHMPDTSVSFNFNFIQIKRRIKRKSPNRSDRQSFGMLQCNMQSKWNRPRKKNNNKKSQNPSSHKYFEYEEIKGNS